MIGVGRILSYGAAIFGLKTVYSVAEDAVSTTETGEAVETLTASNFDAFLEEHELVLVKFYAPWCGHCKTLAPEYEKAAKHFKDTGSKIKLGKVDATQEGSLGERFAIRGYPSLKLFRAGEPEEYGGSRHAEGIIDWIATMTGPAMSEHESEEAVTKAIAEDKASVAFIGTFPAKEGSEYEAFQKMASQNRKAGKFYGVIVAGSTPSVVVRRENEGEIKAPAVTEADLKTFIADESLPYFGPINGENFQQYHERDREMAWFCGSKTDFETAREAVRDAAKDYRQQYSFVWLDTEGYQAHAEKALGLTTFPGLVLQAKAGRYIYPEFAATVSKAQVTQFMEDVKAGLIERSLRSEDAPAPGATNEVVKVVTGKTMEAMVYNDEKDVFLEVYASWCGHCKKFEAAYTEFATNHASNKKLLVTKMDGTLNESPLEEFEWTGFPTVFFIKAGTRKPVKYDGDRTVEKLTAYLALHGTKEDAQADTGKAEEL